MIYDAITYNGEADLLEIRLNVLKPYVDRFIIVEFDKTFSGKDKPLFNGKPLYWERDKDRFAGFPITFRAFYEPFYLKYKELAESSPNTVGADHWKREFMQKECIKDALENCKDDDLIYIGDTDEIWEPYNAAVGINKLKLRVYSYGLNNRSSEQFHGTVVARYGELKDKCLNHVRSSPEYRTKDYFGWHFTSMGGYQSVKQKLSDSYTEESYWNPSVQANLEQNIAQSKDFLGRDFTYSIDESEWPSYLKESRAKYEHLLKSS